MDTEPTTETKLSKPTAENWKKYLFEFVLIFLAVFLGFLADSYREVYAERQQSVELAKSFYLELRNDSIAAAQKVVGRLKKEQAVAHLYNFFRDSSLTSTSKSLSINFIYGIAARSTIIFTPRTVVLEQLKSSGSLRYLKNENLQKLVGDLAVVIDYIQTRQEYENSIFNEYVEPLMVQHMDYDFQDKLLGDYDSIFERIEQYEKSNEYIPFHLSQIEKINRKEIMNALGYFHDNGLRSTRLIPFKNYLNANAALLKALREEYNLK